MNIFFENLNNGTISANLSPQEKEILINLQMINAATKYKQTWYLNNGFFCGVLDINQSGTGFVKIFGNHFKQDLMVENKNLTNANIGDIVLVKILNNNKKRINAKIMLVLKRKFMTSLVYTKKISRDILGVNIRTGLSVRLNASQKSLRLLPVGTILKIDNLKNEIIEVIGNINDPMVDEKISLNIYDKHSDFDETCSEQAKSYGNFVDASMYEDRVDLRSLYFCTIDPIDAKDFDDAIYFDNKNKILYIAIADVSEYVQAFTPIDKEAKFRGFSIYLPHKSIPMLPKELSENLCSLKPNEDRLAFCFKISFDSNNNVVNEEIFTAIINSKYRFNYDEVDILLENKQFDKKFSWLLQLYDFTQKIKNIRLKTGFDFLTKELKLVLDEKLNLFKTYYETSSPSHSLIEECMLLANRAAANIIDNFGIFRNHQSPDYKKISNLLDELAALGIDIKFNNDLSELIRTIQKHIKDHPMVEEINKLIIKSQKKAVYQSTNLGHYGLGFKKYSHFTSPIRRYSDLILHRVIKAKLKKDESLEKYLLLNIDQTCQNLNILEKEADKVAYDFMDRKFARWAEQQKQQIFKAYIIENNNISIAVIDDHIKGAEVFLTNYTDEILTKILIQITEVDIISAKIYARVVKKIDV